MLPLYLCGEMRAAVWLLLLLIGLHGSQAQVAGDTDVWTEVKALKTILMEAMVKQTILQKQVDDLKEEQARGKQSKNAKLLYLWVLSLFDLSSKSKPTCVLIDQEKQRWPFTQP